ncbi:MAG TPA: NAD(P)-binding domain-containing protein [Polyangiaceae bacterium]|jgi:hypothetical protein
MSERTTEVAIIGAGPYGLSVAAHLAERGIDFRIFGPPMSFWLAMPESINLKSFAFGTNVYVPRAHYTFPEYCRANGLEDVEPCSMASFAAYGLWVQRELVPGVEPVDVTDVHGHEGRFELTLANGDALCARRVVLATGLSNYALVPEALARLPREVVTHSSVHREFSGFAGKDVAVLGGGASALEAATMLLEAGARPTLLVRASEIEFHSKFDPRNRTLVDRVRRPVSVLGVAPKSWVLEKFPWLLHHLPDSKRVPFTRKYLGPSGPWWLQERFEGKVPHRLRAKVSAAAMAGERIVLQVSEGSGPVRPLEVDHVVSGTGYEVDVDRLGFLAPDIRARVRRVERAPALSRVFESTFPGLYFVGVSSAMSFGPLFRFVAGAAYAAPTVSGHIAARATRARAWGASRRAVRLGVT